MDDPSRLQTRGGIQVIARAAAVLRSLKESRNGMSLSQIAEQIGLPRSTVQRIVAALQEERLVIASSTGGSIRLGPELHALAGAARYDIVERCRPYLAELARKTGETVDLSVLRGTRMIFLDQVEGTSRLRTVSAVGEAFPLTTTANGRACLAAMPDDRLMKLALAEWEISGAAPDMHGFLGMIKAVRDCGLAYDLGEHSEGIAAIGFGFADVPGDLHAVSVPIPASRLAEKRAQVEQELLAIKAEVLRVLAS